MCDSNIFEYIIVCNLSGCMSGYVDLADMRKTVGWIRPLWRGQRDGPNRYKEDSGTALALL